MGIRTYQYVGVILLGILVAAGTVPGRCLADDSSRGWQDTVIYYPGFFQWDEYTVLSPEDSLNQNILRYQEMLDHANTDFSDRPRTSILLRISPEKVSDRSFLIEVTQDTIQVMAFSIVAMDAALKQLLHLKYTAERNSPDYGLVYIRCGLYRYENF